MSQPVQRLWRRFYPEYRPDEFATIVEREALPNDHVLEIGAGSGEGNQKHFGLRGHVARYVGVDPDHRVTNNRYLDEAYVGVAESLPFPNECFDLVFHSFVAEHFEAPSRCTREIARVLKPGGRLLFLTPSRFYYPMLAAKVTPHSFHRSYIKRLGSGRESNEVFPTFYRLNDDRSIARELGSCGLTFDIQHRSTPPGYLRFSRISFLAGTLYERTFERSFPALRARIIVIARKPA